MAKTTQRIYVLVAWIAGITALMTGPILGGLYSNSASEFAPIFAAAYGMAYGAFIAATVSRITYQFIFIPVITMMMVSIIIGPMYMKGPYDPTWTLSTIYHVTLYSLTVVFLPGVRFLLEGFKAKDCPPASMILPA